MALNMAKGQEQLAGASTISDAMGMLQTAMMGSLPAQEAVDAQVAQLRA